jgi:hypothetical protein
MAQRVRFERAGPARGLHGLRHEGPVRAVSYRHLGDAPHASPGPPSWASPLGVSRATYPAGRSARLGYPHLAAPPTVRPDHDQHPARHPR